MNRNIFITALLLSLGAGRAALAQEANAGAAPARISLQTLMQKNIFDPTRSGRVERSNRPRVVRIRTFTFRGTIGDGDVALFTGEGTGKGYLKVGNTLNGFKVMKIPVSYTDPIVILTDPNGAIVQLKEGESMRREEDGPWTKSDQPPPATVAGAETSAEASTAASSSAAPADASDILKRLRLKREQEEK